MPSEIEQSHAAEPANEVLSDQVDARAVPEGTAAAVSPARILGPGVDTRTSVSSLPEPVKSTSAGTVLVVEDDDLLRAAIANGLRKRRFAVLESGDGAMALSLIRSEAAKIDAVLLDIVLRGISSRKIFEEVRRVQPRARVILTSGHTKDRALASFGDVHIEHFLRKPFHLEELFRALQDIGEK